MSTALNSTQAFTSDEEVLAFTQLRRKQLVETMLLSGVPADKGDKVVLLQALSDMDKPALVKMRIASEDKNAAGNAQAAQAIAQLMAQVNPRNLKVVDVDATAIPPSLDQSLTPAFQYVDGQMDIGTQSGSYDEFMKIHGNNET